MSLSYSRFDKHEKSGWGWKWTAGRTPIEIIKDGCEISPGRYTEGHRCGEAFEVAYYLVLDVDEGPTIAQATEKFKDHDGVIYTTRSHRKPKKTETDIADRFRVVLRLSEPITVFEDYERVYSAFIPWGADPRAKDGCHYFFGIEDGATVLQLTGTKTVDVAAILAEKPKPPKVAIVTVPSTTLPDKSELEERATSYVAKFPSLSDGRKGESFRIAAILRNDFALDEEAARRILTDWNARNTPPLETEYIDKALRSGLKYAKKPFACKAASGKKECYRCTDDGNARRFVDMGRARVRWIEEMGQWFWYDGAKWEVSKSIELELARGVIDSIRTDAEAMRATKPEIAEAMKEWAQKSESAARINAMIALAKLDGRMQASINDFDSQPLLWNLGNGTWNFETNTLQPHRPEDMLTAMSPYEYDPTAKCPKWDEALKLYWPDEDIRRSMRCFMGYSATGLNCEKSLFIMHGESADNGKSTLLNILAGVIGKGYSQRTPMSTFLERRGEATNDLAALKGVRLVIASETVEGAAFNDALIKRLTGKDVERARFLFKEFFEFEPRCKIWLAVNDLPKVRNFDNAIRNRIRLVPLEYAIPKEKQIKDFDDVIKAEEASGIINYLIAGYNDYKDKGLYVAKAIEEATDRYRDKECPIQQFIDDWCTVDAAAKTQLGDLHQRYVDSWKADAPGRKPLDKANFGKKLRARGWTTRQAADRRVYVDGLRLNTPPVR